MEKQEKKKGIVKKEKWILGILAALAVVAAGLYVFLFYINQFYLSVQPKGDLEMYLEYGDRYTDPGVEVRLHGTMFWQEGIPAEDAVIVIDNQINENKLGRYAVTYSVEFHNWMAEAQRSVRVVDNQAPLITLVDRGEPLLAGTAYEEEGFTATDNYDGDITNKVLRVERYGLVTYTVTDSSGNPAYVEREIPYYDPLPPQINLEEGEHITITAGTWFMDPGFSAVDNVDGDMTELVEVSGEVLWYVPGTYELTYTVADGYDNRATVVRRVDVEGVPWTETVIPEGKVIYLTFDDGPGPYTEDLLDLLAKYNVKATFFCVDTGYNSVMRKIVDQGHSIGIHSVSHIYEEIYASPEAYFTDLHKMQTIIYENTGVMTTLVRFPGGSSNTISRFNRGIMTTLSTAVQDAGFQFFDWNVDSKDAGGATETDDVVENVIDGIRKHRVSIVLQHDIHAHSIAAVEEIILWGLENGYTFLPLEQDSPGLHHGIQN